jgi:thioredoxin reductase (NADPH)
MTQTDILIIGAGPAGISAALYLARANASFVWLEKAAPGGKLLNIHEVGNYPGIPNANGFDLAMSLLKSTETLGVSSVYGEVKNVHKEDGRFIVATEEETYSALALIVATGLSNVPTIPGEKDLLGKGVPSTRIVLCQQTGRCQTTFPPYLRPPHDDEARYCR